MQTLRQMVQSSTIFGQLRTIQAPASIKTLTIFVDINNHSGETNMHRMAESQQQLRMCHVNWPVLRKVKLKGEATLEGEVTSESPTSSYSLKKKH